MRLRNILALLLILAGSSVWAVDPSAPLPANGVTLEDCFNRARRISETVSISAENVRLLQNQYRSEIGAVLPHIDWIKSQFYQDQADAGSGGGATGSAFLTVQPLSYFQVTQPIFAGFRDWYAISIAKSQTLQAKMATKSTDLQLLGDVALAFYTALTLQDQMTILIETRKLNLDQVNQLQKWVDIGRSRPSELLSAQTLLASLDAQIEESRRTIAESRHMLLFLTGVPADVPLVDPDPLPPGMTVEDALERSGKRPDLMIAAESVGQANMSVRMAQGAHLPTLGLAARSYTERVGFLSDVRWDATFLLDVPIYYGGSTQAQVRVARSEEIIAQLNLSHTKRDVDRQVRTAYDDLSHAVAEVQAYDKAVTLANKNYVVQQREYRLGIITNLDLLTLLTNLQNVRGQWLLARANARLDDVRLKIAMGEGL